MAHPFYFITNLGGIKMVVILKYQKTKQEECQ